ncbi:MAG TPA: hypothetical protein VFQ24_01305 [Terriglobia bacterium]|nr:hypothetical protein [Terriglobia bacterium]
MTQTIHSRLSLVLLGGLLFPVAATTPAQSLGEVARQCRRERQAGEKKGEVPFKKVFTNDDIARMPPISILKSSIQTTSSPEMKPSPPSPPAEATASGTQTAAPAAVPEKERSIEKSKEYWQARFRAAHARLTHAKEEQTLVEDELQLLQVQQARELNPGRSRELNGRIDASTVELEGKRAAMEKAQRAMGQLEKEFNDSGAPQGWIQKDPTAGQ